MTKNAVLKKAQAAAHTPEANAKRAATMAAKKAGMKKVTSIPLNAIPDDPPKAKLKKAKAKIATLDGFTREQMALEIIRLTTLLLK